MCCSQRVDALEGPFFDFGELDDGQVELLAGDPLGKKQRHDDVLVCAGCVRKAAGKLPGAADSAAAHERELAAARSERDKALQLASSMASEMSVKLDTALASSDQDPRGQSNMTLPSPETQAPPQLSPANEQAPADVPPDHAIDLDDLDGKTVRQLRSLARERDIPIPADITTRDGLLEHLQEQLTAPEDA